MTANSDFLDRARSPKSGIQTFAAALAFIPRRISRWAQYRRDLHHLSSLDDRMLHDIGISRTEVAQAIFRGRA